MKEKTEIEQLIVRITVLQNLICQYKLQKDPENQQEMQNKINELIKTTNTSIKSVKPRSSSKYDMLTAYYYGIIKEFEEFVHEAAEKSEDNDDFEETLSRNEIERNLVEIDFDPSQESKEELDTLRAVQAIKKATLEYVSDVNTKIAEQGQMIDTVEANSEFTLVRTEQAAKEIQQVAKFRRGVKMSIVKLIGAALGWIVGGPITGIAIGLGLHAAQRKLSKVYDKKLKRIAKA